MTTSSRAAGPLVEPPVNMISDTVRLKFHELTHLVLPRSVCQTCWLNIVAVCTETIERNAILKVEHDCPHYVEPDVVLYHALQGLPPEDYWAMPDPWSEEPLSSAAELQDNGQHDHGLL